jgi:site-specific DNA-cytosine methylase
MFKDIITGGSVERVKALAILESESRICTSQESIKKRAKKEFINMIYVDKDKAGCLLHGDYKMFIKDPVKQDIYLKKRIENGQQTPNLIYEINNELRCKTNTKQGFDIVTENDCLDLSFPTSTTRRGRVTKGKSPCLMESNNNLYSYKDGIVRTVNQIEMERLQGFPDGYTSILSKSKAGSLLGDGWTLPIIEHIFKFIER